MRTLRPACTGAAAPEGSQGATASITLRCTVTQVPGGSQSRRVSTAASSYLCVSPAIPEACGPDATCINRANGLGYDCRCHLGKFGNKCMEGKMWPSNGGGLVMTTADETHLRGTALSSRRRFPVSIRGAGDHATV